MPKAFSGFWKTSPPNKHYYRVRNGERALSPAEQQNIINILKECVVTFSIEFDSYFEDYYWSNTL